MGVITVKKVLIDQVGFLPESAKKAVLTFETSEFEVISDQGKSVFKGNVTHFGKDEISGEDTYVADFSELKENGRYKVLAGGEESLTFDISDRVYLVKKGSLKRIK